MGLVTHSGVHAWYFGTIDLGATQDELLELAFPELSVEKVGVDPEAITVNRTRWYLDEKGLIEGFSSSPLGGENSVERDMLLLTPGEEYDAQPSPQISVPNGIPFNGGFGYPSNESDLNDFPGWLHQGGSGDANLDSGKLELSGGFLDPASHLMRTHNWFFVPRNATAISFKLECPGFRPVHGA